ncbi:MAG: hypothetical protein BWX73_03081 [Lentisphaerae bacterium ADurb.Bin082]|nr:MAG: hypothetical protein BWX73_03081 [Lentisphaerae bacterium ADurb.Bin082]
MRRGGHPQDVALDETGEDEVTNRRGGVAVVDLVLRRESDCNRLWRDGGRHIVGEVDGVVALVIAGHGESLLDGHVPLADLAFSEAGRGSHLQGIACDKAREAEVPHRRGGVAVIDLVVRRESDRNRFWRDGGCHIVGEVDFVVALVIAGHGESLLDGHCPLADLAFSEVRRGRHLQGVAFDDAIEDEVPHDRGDAAVVDLVIRRESHRNRLGPDVGLAGRYAEQVQVRVCPGQLCPGQGHRLALPLVRRGEGIHAIRVGDSYLMALHLSLPDQFASTTGCRGSVIDPAGDRELHIIVFPVGHQVNPAAILAGWRDVAARVRPGQNLVANAGDRHFHDLPVVAHAADDLLHGAIDRKGEYIAASG